MARTAKDAFDRVVRVMQAWEYLRPSKSFSGMTLAQAKDKVQPSIDARNQIVDLENQLTAALNRRADSDRVSIETAQFIVNAVRGDPEEGQDGELYEAMGYVRKSERKSGLKRPRKPAEPAK